MGRNADNKTQVITEQCDTLGPAENRGTKFIFLVFSLLSLFFSFPRLSRRGKRNRNKKKKGEKK
jgi:hypothetical protein